MSRHTHLRADSYQDLHCKLWLTQTTAPRLWMATGMLILSGCVNHGNTPIQQGETRYSMTQYATGALFRWAAYGYQSAKSLLAQPGGQERKDVFDGVPGSAGRWLVSRAITSRGVCEHAIAHVGTGRIFLDPAAELLDGADFGAQNVNRLC
ncbi:hypothetical protein B0H10DRAFT_1948899 [Mycena sp. CBHHK59/15]|nr:hypothetical protein B0H10DRAFT_1948899 [Mycena sp. CBHHK59/15]